MDLPGIRQVGFDQPFQWLRAGARDMARAWPLSLFYGVVFALLGYGLVQGAWDKPHLALALTSGFLFVAPVLATVFYSLSHRLEHQRKLPSLAVPLLSWRANPASFGLFAVMLVFVLISWERLSAILVGLFLAGSGIGGLADLLSLRALQAAHRVHAGLPGVRRRAGPDDVQPFSGVAADDAPPQGRFRHGAGHQLHGDPA